MAVAVSAPPALSGELSLFHTTDPLLSNSPVLVFHGPAATIGTTSSRIQVHVFTPAGYDSYPRLAVSPNSPFYTAVSNLPREEQGDEVVRGLAFGLKKYFSELSEEVKKKWCTEAKAPSLSALFGDAHVAILASRMRSVENVDEVIGEVTRAFGEQRLSWLDVDVVLPSGSIKETPNQSASEDDESQTLLQRYGRYAEFVNSIGDVAFVPTSKLKRAPSKASSIGRSASFLKSHKENVRMEFTELLNTEESYVDRISELLTLSQELAADDNAATQEQLQMIFPSTLQSIVRLNTAFLTGLRTIMQATEEAAWQDIDGTTDDEPTALRTRQDLAGDTQGVREIAQYLCDWFPKFTSDYREYVESHTKSTQVLREVLRNANSTLAAHLQEVGEQKLSSLLIEPVQRLPRYNLYIDSISKQLPIRHPAAKMLLSARDIITEICDDKDMATTAATTISKLQSHISSWPAEIKLSGRLVTAADFTEIVPPYSAQGCDADQGILLLFTDGLVFVQKQGPNATSARTLLTEIEIGQPSARQFPVRPTTPHDLRFLRTVQLDSVDCLEMLSGEALQILTASKSDGSRSHASKVDVCQVLRLEGFYERKAERLSEEITKAKVEGRFSEPERESPKWEARASDPTADTASVFSAVFEDSNPDFVKMRSSSAPIRVIVDIDRHTHRPRAGQNGIRTVVSASPLRDGLWRLVIDSVNGSIGREHLPLAELVKVIRRKLSALSVVQFGIEQSALTGCLLARNLDILQSIKLHLKTDEDDSASQTSKQERVIRPISPRKLFSSFLSSTGPGNQPPVSLKKDLPSLPMNPSLRASAASQDTPKPPSRDSRPSSKDQLTPKSMVSMRSTEQMSSPLKKLEDTLSAYLLALQARKGNIVGRNLKMRALADELAVNELYNCLLEDPNMMVLAAQAPVDVLFSAFEKFLNMAWKESVGSVLPYHTLQEIQSKAETMFPADFDEYFKSTVNSFSPQNHRAFKSITKLLADLLDGTGNDSDRGILTCAFAEVLVTEGDPYKYIALIDRFVDDPDTYFGEPFEETQKADNASHEHKRARSVNSASVTSNTSSLRRKFGFGVLTRENSKSEAESKVASVWRTLSKGTRVDASPASSISKGTLFRSQSTDVDVRSPPSRPVSHDGPLGAKPPLLGEDSSLSATSSMHNLGLSTIGEHPSFIPTQPPKKKRRSSLSDLKGLQVSGDKSPAWSPPASASRLPPVAQRFNVDKSLPNSPMPSTPSSKGGSGRYGTPSKEPPRSRLPSAFRKENSPGSARAFDATQQRPKSSDSKPDEIVITNRPTSSIPTFAPKGLSPLKATTTTAPSTPARTGLAERPGAGNIVKKPSPQQHDKSTKSSAVSHVSETGSPAKKLRMQSPQKLRERLHNEQTAIAAAQTSLQEELSKISDELASTPSRGAAGSHSVRARGNTTQPSSMDLAQRVLKMETQLSTHVEELLSRIASIKADMASSLTVSETKCKKLDDLYREANGENEALYVRFNEELGRVLKAVRGGEGVEELRRKLRESQEEAGKLKRENGRLKRECAGLRAQLGGG